MGMIINRRRTYGGSKMLPYDAEIEYLESSGTQYINTGIYPDNTYTFDTKIAVLRNSYNCVYWGCKSGSDNHCYLNSNTMASDIRFIKIRLWSTSITSDSNWDSGTIPSVGVMYNFAGITVVGTMQKMSYPITLFAYNNIGTVNSSAGVCRIGLFTAYSQGEKIIDMIPVRVGQVGYMYDKVSGRLFGNSGTGNFILGADKN